MKGERRTTYEILRVSEGSLRMKIPEHAVVLDSSFVCFALPLCLSALLWGYSEGLWFNVSRANLENCVVWFCLCSLRLVNFDYQCSNLTWSLKKRCIESYRSPPFQNYRVNLENARRARWEAEARQVIEQISKKCPGCQTNIEKNGE